VLEQVDHGCGEDAEPRDRGARAFMEVLLLDAPASPGNQDQEVTVEPRRRAGAAP
jgi:hypothetical protein